MHFFLTQILARVVAAYLAWDSFRKLRGGLADGTIATFNPGLLDWFSYRPAVRAKTPVQFWLEMGLHGLAFVCCVVVAIFGWLEP